MATINNSNTIKRILNDAGIQTSHDEVPSQLASKIVPVLISNPQYYSKTLSTYIDTATRTGFTIYTTDTIKQTYITSISVNLHNDVTCDNTIQTLTFNNQDGAVGYFFSLSKDTTTATRDFFQLSFNPPIKIPKNSTLKFTNAFTAGASNTNIQLFGYEV